MSIRIIFLLILSFQLCLGHGLEEKVIWKNHPELRDLLQNYWQAFQVAKVSDTNTGKSLAALLKLGDVEEELEKRGFDDKLLEELRTQAQDAYTEMLQKKEERFSKESFYFSVDALEKVKPETMEGVVFSIKNYAKENASRSQGLERFLAALDEQERIIDPGARFAFFKLSVSFFMLAEAQDFIGKDEALTLRLNRFSGLSLADFLITSEGLNVGLTNLDLQRRILGPIDATFLASGVPNLKEVAQGLIDHYKNNPSEPKIRSFFENISLALKNRKNHFNYLSLMAPLLTAGVATSIGYFGSIGPNGWQMPVGQDLFAVLFVYGMAVRFFVKDFLGFGIRDHFKSYFYENNRSRRIQSNKKDVLQSLQKSCRTAVQ